MLDFIASWRREREAIRELSGLPDRELDDLGIARADIRAIVRGAARPAASREPAETLAPAWGSHVRASVAA